MVRAKRFVLGATAAARAPQDELPVLGVDPRVVLGPPVLGGPRQVLVGHRQGARVWVDFDAEPVAQPLEAPVALALSELEVGLEREACRGLGQELGQPTWWQRERFRGKSPDGRSKGLGQGSLRPGAREHLQGVEGVALAGGVGTREHGQPRQLELHVDERLEAADR